MNKRRIVQIEYFYPDFLHSLEARWPGFAAMDFAAQIRGLLASGFSGGHNVVPFLDAARWEAHYLVPNCASAQQRWAAQNGMAGASASDILAAQLRAIEPDVVYLSGIPGFDFGVLDALPRQPFVIGWHATRVDPRIAWNRFDLVLSGIAPIRAEVRRLGARASVEFMPSAPPYLMAPRPHGPAHGVVFSGSFYGGIHDARAAQLRALSQRLDEGSVDVFSAARFADESTPRLGFFPPVYGNEVIELYANARIVLDSRGEFGLGEGGAARETSNMRIFEATRAGSLLLTERSPNLERYFALGDEIETFVSFDELVEKCNFYLAARNETARAKVAAAGLARVRREHLIEHRAGWFEQILREQFGSASVPGRAKAADVHCREAYALIAGASSLLFAATQIERLRQRDPHSSIHLVCLDQASLGAAMAMKLPVTLATGRDAGVDALDDPAELRVGLRVLRHLLALHPNSARVTLLGNNLDVSVLPALDVAGQPVFLGEYDFGRATPPRTVRVPPRWMGLLSVPNGTSGLDIVEALLGESEATLSRQADAVGKLVWLRIGTAWAWPLPAPGTALAALGPVSLVDGNTWQFVEARGAHDWPGYFTAYYVPFLREAQELAARYPLLATLGDQHLAADAPPERQLTVDQAHLARQGYRLLSAEAYARYGSEAGGWDRPEVAQIQHMAFQRLLAEFRARRQRADLVALFRIFRRLLHPGARVLEEGCGSGYNVELIALLGRRFEYTGIDIAASMIALAKATYPTCHFETMASNALGFADGEFDIVLNGASLMHTIDYAGALREARRVAAHHVVLHTVTIADTDSHTFFEKSAYGSRVAEVVFSASALGDLLDANRLLPIIMEPSIEYDMGALVGTPTRSVSLACACVDDVPAVEKFGHAYCTYFDVNYLPRGVAMMRSLLRHDPGARIHVLCMDEIAEAAIRQVMPAVVVIRLDDLLLADPEFAAARHNRSRVEWYFTATSCLVNYLMGLFPSVERWVYLDADLYFYAPPALLLEEASGAPVQIIEHRFSERWEQHIKYGRFNVGWIGFSTSIAGRQVVADYRADCIEWCYDRLEGDRFGDQKYLDKWPTRYPGCCVTAFNGANVACWNIEQWHVQRLGRHLFVGSDLLIFYHFQQVKRLESGEYQMKNPIGDYGDYYEAVYRPYLQELTATDREIQSVVGQLPIRDLRYQQW